MLLQNIPFSFIIQMNLFQNSLFLSIGNKIIFYKKKDFADIVLIFVILKTFLCFIFRLYIY